MVTAPAPALSDSHALPQAAVGAASNSPKSLNSFLSVFESLPAHQTGSGDALLPQNSISKAPVSKKPSSKDTDDKLVAIVSPATVDSSMARAIPSSHPSFSLTARDPATNETTQSATAKQEAALPDPESQTEVQPVLPNGVKYVAKADIGSVVQSAAKAQMNAESPIPADVGSSFQNGVRSALPDESKYVAQAGLEGSFQAGQRTAAARANVSNSPAVTESANQIGARRAPALNSQATASAPSFSIGAPALPTIPEISLPDALQPATASRSPRTSAGSSSQPAADAGLFTKGLAATLAPRQDNLAFSLKMAESNSAARHAQQATQSETADRNGIPAQAKSQERAPALALQPNAPHASATQAPTTGEVAAVVSTMNHAWNVAATPQPEVSGMQFSESREPATLSTVAAMHEAQQILPETARPNAAAEIMLQLGGKDQAAAIRVTDRAGTVNVSVHAADADLRSSLRSNLGDLASQLSHQGWKTEVVKAGTVLTRAETSQDPQQGGQRSPNQQQPSSQGDRQQQQRDRRSNSGQWLAEYEEQASGNSGGTK